MINKYHEDSYKNSCTEVFPCSFLTVLKREHSKRLRNLNDKRMKHMSLFVVN